MLIKHTIRTLFNILYPPCCLICDENILKANSFCGKCWNSITFISKPHCIKCGIALPSQEIDNICYKCQEKPPLFDKAICVFKYDDITKPLIHDLKFNDVIYAANTYSELMGTYGKELILSSDLIIPVPVSRKKLAKRKYNQALLLAKPIAKRYKIPLIYNNLKKFKETSSQVGLKKDERQFNLEQAFVVKKPQAFNNKIVLIIDDVLTTGATANACAKILKQNGASKIYVLALGRTY